MIYSTHRVVPSHDGRGRITGPLPTVLSDIIPGAR